VQTLLERPFKKYENDFIVKIGDVEFSEKDKPNSSIVRVKMNGIRYYCHKDAQFHDVELIRAIFTPEVDRIETL